MSYARKYTRKYKRNRLTLRNRNHKKHLGRRELSKKKSRNTHKRDKWNRKKGNREKGNRKKGNREKGKNVQHGGGIVGLAVGGMTFVTVYPLFIMWSVQKIFGKNGRHLGAAWQKKIEHGMYATCSVRDFKKAFKFVQSAGSWSPIRKSKHQKIAASLEKLEKKLGMGKHVECGEYKIRTHRLGGRKFGEWTNSNNKLLLEKLDMGKDNPDCSEGNISGQTDFIRKSLCYYPLPTAVQLDKKITKRINRPVVKRIRRYLSRYRTSLMVCQQCYNAAMDSLDDDDFDEAEDNKMEKYEEWIKEDKSQFLGDKLWIKYRNLELWFNAIMASGDSKMRGNTKFYGPVEIDTWRETGVPSVEIVLKTLYDEDTKKSLGELAENNFFMELKMGDSINPIIEAMKNEKGNCSEELSRKERKERKKKKEKTGYNYDEGKTKCYNVIKGVMGDKVECLIINKSVVDMFIPSLEAWDEIFEGDSIGDKAWTVYLKSLIKTGKKILRDIKAKITKSSKVEGGVGEEEVDGGLDSQISKYEYTRFVETLDIVEENVKTRDVEALDVGKNVGETGVVEKNVEELKNAMRPIKLKINATTLQTFKTFGKEFYETTPPPPAYSEPTTLTLPPSAPPAYSEPTTLTLPPSAPPPSAPAAALTAAAAYSETAHERVKTQNTKHTAHL